MNNKNDIILSGGPDLPICNENTRSLGEFIIKKLKEYDDKILLINANTNEKLTANELLENLIRVAHSLRSYGIKNGDVVTVCSENSFEFLYIFFGTILCGAVTNPVNTSYTEDELLHIFSATQPRIVFSTKACIEKFRNIAKQCEHIEKIISFESDETVGDTDHKDTLNVTYQAFINDQCTQQNIDDFKCNDEDMENTVAYIISSSGTTGLPKGVETTQYNIFVGITQFFYHDNRTIEDKLCPNPNILSVLPWYHMYGAIIIMAQPIFLGHTVVFLPRFKPAAFLEAIQNYKINTAYLVPPLMIFLAKNPQIDNYNLSSLKCVWCASAPITEDIMNVLQKRTNVKIIRQGYGLTETTLAVTSQTDNRCKLGSIGELLPGVKGKVRCLETNDGLGPNQRGELLFKTRGLMKGYKRAEDATASTIDEHGWLHTGDIGYYDDIGEFYIVDRLKDLIKYKGFQVAPAEIENILMTHPAVVNVGVIGIPDEMAGEIPRAFIVKKPNDPTTAQEIIDFVASKISYTKRLYGGVCFVDDLPKSAIGKVLRKNLRQLL